MKFTVAGSRIICSRKDSTAEDDGVYRHVVEFDSHVDTVPPHVAARLTASEIDQLKEFIADRMRIQANPAAKNMLEFLPDLIAEATGILDSVDEVNQTMYKRLSKSIDGLRASLEKVSPTATGRVTPVKRMRRSEAQKERLENIKKVL